MACLFLVPIKLNYANMLFNFLNVLFKIQKSNL